MLLLNYKLGKYYFITICIIGSALFLTFSSILYYQHNEARRINRWAIHYYEVIRVTRLLLIDVLNMETGVRGYLLTGQDTFLEPYNIGVSAYKNDEYALREMVENDDDKIRQKIGQIIPEISKYSALLQSEVESRRTQGSGYVAPAILQTQKVNTDYLRQLIEDFTNTGLHDLNDKLRAASQKEREFIYTLVTGVILSVGAMVFATMIILSLVERSRRAEEETRKTEERFRMVMNEVNDGIFDFDLSSRAIYYSPAYKAMLGYSEDEYPNTIEMFKENLHPDDVPNTLEVSRRYRHREIPAYTNVFRLRHKNGGWRWILSRGVGTWDKNGKMVRLIGTHTDITTHKNREEELKQLNNDLENFTYITSHDLRSPLVNLKGFASEMEYSLKRITPILQHAQTILSQAEQEVLKESFEKEIPEALDFITKAVEKMDIITNAVLNLSRIGRREILTEAIDTESVVKRCLGSIAYEIARKDVEITYGLLPIIYSDPFAVEQIFGNLLDNAVKYLLPSRKGTIAISSQLSGKDIIFSIKDNGRGISANERHKIFNIFRRASNAADVRGMGIGMAYTQATIRKLGGSIWVESVVNEGTTFHFRLNNVANETMAAA